MKYIAIFVILGAVVLFIACNPKTTNKVTEVANPKMDTPKKVNPTAGNATAEPAGAAGGDETTPMNSKPAFVSASIRKTPCFGKCPVFSVEFSGTGKAFYKGKKNVKRIGEFEADITHIQRGMILEKAQQIGYFNMAKTYPKEDQMIADFPMTITNIKFGRQNKTVTNNSDAPQELIDFENFLLEMTETLKWVEVIKD